MESKIGGKPLGNDKVMIRIIYSGRIGISQELKRRKARIKKKSEELWTINQREIEMVLIHRMPKKERTLFQGENIHINIGPKTAFYPSGCHLCMLKKHLYSKKKTLRYPNDNLYTR